MSYRLSITLLLLLPLMGCELKNEDQNKSSLNEHTPSGSSLMAQYPMLAEYLDMDESEFNIYLNTGLDSIGVRDLTKPENIKSLNIGYPVDTQKATYVMRSVFNLAALKKDDLLFVDDAQSSRTDSFEIKSSASSSLRDQQWSVGGSANIKRFGFKVAAKYHHAEANATASTVGSVSAIMRQVGAGKTITIGTVSMDDSGDNFTAYLVGTALTEEELEKKVHTVVEPASVGKCHYIKAVNIDGKPLDKGNIYGSIQVLSKMQTIFAQLQTQYNQCNDAETRQTLVVNMRELRKHIIKEIQTFYKQNGDSFVTKVEVMNRAIGEGKLSFGSNSSNSEHYNGGGLSISYSGIGAGGGVSAEFTESLRKAKSDIFKNINITVTAEPDSIDISGWRKELGDWMNNLSVEAGKAIVLPTASTLPKTVDIKFPDTELQKPKEELQPPSHLFKSLDEWEKYYKKTDPEKDAQTTQAKVEQGQPQPQLNSSVTLYQQFQKELNALNEARDQQKQAEQKPLLFALNADDNGNNVRVPGTFTNDFELRAYDEVIPQLRPDLKIPDETEQTFEGYENLQTLMIELEKLGRLNSYLSFLSTLPVSQVSSELSQKFSQFYSNAADKAYEIIIQSMTAGVDVNSNILNGWMLDQLGKIAKTAENANIYQGKLYEELGTPEYYDYVRTLLDPVKGKVWSEGSGGYMPLRIQANGEPELAIWADISAYNDDKYGNKVMQSVAYRDRGQNPLSLYKNTPMQTPWYPVYIFNPQDQGKDKATLVFIQMFGAYQTIYGRAWVVQPTPQWLGTVDKNHNDGVYISKDSGIAPSLESKWAFWASSKDDKQDRYQVLNDEMKKVIFSSGNSFLPDGNWDYSLNFPYTSSPDDKLWKKFNVLYLPLTGHDQSTSKPILGLHSVARPYNPNNSLGAYRYFKDQAGTVYNQQKQIKAIPQSQSLVLLPLNTKNTDFYQNTAAKTGYLLPFDYAPKREAIDIVNATSMQTFQKLALFNQLSK